MSFDMAFQQLRTIVTVLVLILYQIKVSNASCRYRYTEQPSAKITCNPYTNGRLATMCTMTHETNEEHIDMLLWVFVSEAGNIQTLTSSDSGGKYAITQTKEGTNVKSQLIINNLDSSDEGSYYCQAYFSNGTSLHRSQEINLFESLVYDQLHDSACDQSNIESTIVNRCVLFTGEVVQPLPSIPSTETPTVVSSATTPLTNDTADSLTTEQGTTTNSTSTMAGGNDTMATTSLMPPQQPKQNGGGVGESTEGGITVTNILLYSAIGAVILLILIITVLVLCVCLCNRACDCCRLCS